MSFTCDIVLTSLAVCQSSCHTFVPHLSIYISVYYISSGGLVGLRKIYSPLETSFVVVRGVAPCDGCLESLSDGAIYVLL